MTLRRRCKNLLVWLPLALATMPGCKDLQAERVAYMQMRAAGGGLLVVGQIPDEVTGEQRLGRVALMDTNGLIHHKLEERTACAIEGITAEVIWITRKTATGDLSANATDTLEPKPGIAEAIAAHPVLSTTYEVLGMLEDKLVLRGANNRSYSIDAAGAIEPIAEDAAFDSSPPISGGKRDQGRLRLEPISTRGDERGVKIHAALDNATAFSDSVATLGSDSGDLLVHSTVFAKGSVSPQISRVAPSGDILWTASLAELAAPITVAEAEIKLVALTPLGDAAWLLIRASKMSRQQQTDYYEVEHRLVQLDVSTGQAAASHTVRNKP